MNGLHCMPIDGDIDDESASIEKQFFFCFFVLLHFKIDPDKIETHFPRCETSNRNCNSKSIYKAIYYEWFKWIPCNFILQLKCHSHKHTLHSDIYLMPNCLSIVDNPYHWCSKGKRNSFDSCARWQIPLLNINRWLHRNVISTRIYRCLACKIKIQTRKKKRKWDTDACNTNKSNTKSR